MNDTECNHQKSKENEQIIKTTAPQTTHENENVKYFFMSDPSISEDNDTISEGLANRQQHQQFKQDGESDPVITPEDANNENIDRNMHASHHRITRQLSKEKNNNNESKNSNNNTITENNVGAEVNSAYSSSSTLSTVGKARANQFLLGLKRDSVRAVYVAKPGEETPGNWEDEDECSGVDVPTEVLYTNAPVSEITDIDVSRPSSECNSPSASASADDEKTMSFKEKKRVSRPHRMTSKIHRRSRSGDVAAASLIHGGRQDWIGMSMTFHESPLPCTDDDDSEPALDVDRNSGFHGRRRRASSGSIITRAASGGSASIHQLDDTHDSMFYSVDSNQSEHLDTEGVSSVFSWLSRPSSVSPTLTSDKDDQLGEAPTSPIIQNSPTPLSPRQPPTPMSPLKEDVLQSITPFDISKFNPFQSTVADDEADKYATFICPKCGTRQRHFFNINTVQGQFESPAGYFAFYIAIYVIASLFLFGLEEGWSVVDCIYFSVITLTTAGLGDFTPSSDAAKLFCCIFIYFGVACIGLLLGSLLASGMDEKNRKEANEHLMNCLHCKHQFIMDQKRDHNRDQPQPQKYNFAMSERLDRDHTDFKKFRPTLKRIDSSASFGMDSDVSALDTDHTLEKNIDSDYFNYSSTDDAKEYDNRKFDSISTKASNRENSNSLDKVNENTPFIPKPSSSGRRRTLSDADVFGASFRKHRNYTADFNAYHSMETSSFELEQSNAQNNIPEKFETSSQSTDDYSSYGNNILPNLKLKNAKYVFQTVKQAIVNSIFIIFIGSLGFYFIEKWTIVDSFYFTTVLLTTVGYGDLSPRTSEGKLFATAYVLVAGTVLLNNMSTISMIPLELRRRRQEVAVLRQFGDHLDDAALRELASGTLVRSLFLTPNNQNEFEPHLNECTREMFSLAMLVRLGRISEKDIQSTFHAFSRLDCDNDGKLSSKDIICGTVKAHKREKRRKCRKSLAKARDEDSKITREAPSTDDLVTRNQSHDYSRVSHRKYIRNVEVDQINRNHHEPLNGSHYQNIIPYVPSLADSNQFDVNLNGNGNRHDSLNYHIDVEIGRRANVCNNTNIP